MATTLNYDKIQEKLNRWGRLDQYGQTVEDITNALGDGPKTFAELCAADPLSFPGYIAKAIYAMEENNMVRVTRGNSKSRWIKETDRVELVTSELAEQLFDGKYRTPVTS